MLIIYIEVRKERKRRTGVGKRAEGSEGNDWKIDNVYVRLYKE